MTITPNPPIWSCLPSLLLSELHLLLIIKAKGARLSLSHRPDWGSMLVLYVGKPDSRKHHAYCSETVMPMDHLNHSSNNWGVSLMYGIVSVRYDYLSNQGIWLHKSDQRIVHIKSVFLFWLVLPCMIGLLPSILIAKVLIIGLKDIFGCSARICQILSLTVILSEWSVCLNELVLCRRRTHHQQSLIARKPALGLFLQESSSHLINGVTSHLTQGHLQTQRRPMTEDLITPWNVGDQQLSGLRAWRSVMLAVVPTVFSEHNLGVEYFCVTWWTDLGRAALHQ